MNAPSGGESFQKFRCFSLAVDDVANDKSARFFPKNTTGAHPRQKSSIIDVVDASDETDA